ncbi:hypothetical protein ACX0G7_09840 [Flavitalea antarctica]
MSQLTMLFLAQPKNQKAQVLKYLIERETISEQEARMNAFRTRLSDLRLEYHVNVLSKKVEFTTVLGKPSKYNAYYLKPEDKDQAIKIYEEINK